MNVFETSHLTKKYSKHVVLDDVNLCVREGEIYGLVGRNGAGKSTLIRTLLGVTSPTSGEIKINGAVSADALCYERKKIGALIDTPAYLPHLSGYDNMKAYALSLGEFNDKTIRELLQKVGLNPNDSLKVNNYSLGMKGRLSIAMALIGNPSVLVLDEPVNGLDPTGIFEVREILQRLNREDKVTILISSHLLSELSRLATSYGIMDNGKLVKEMRGSDLDEMCRPYIKLVVGNLKIALRTIIDHYQAHEFEILPYNTLAIYNLEKHSIAEVADIFTKANAQIVSITQCEGDLESTFITLMGGIHNDEN